MKVTCTRDIYDNLRLYTATKDYDVEPAPYLAEYFDWPEALKAKLRSAREAEIEAKLKPKPVAPGKPVGTATGLPADAKPISSLAKDEDVVDAARLHEKIAADKAAKAAKEAAEKLAAKGKPGKKPASNKDNDGKPVAAVPVPGEDDDAFLGE
jgi:hypothetical protein